jgi:predicted nuclease of predicted toxin-antitoxin system
VRIILDEQLDPKTVEVLNVLESRHGCNFQTLRDLVSPGTPDVEVPEICRNAGAVALVTADVKDFGAKRVYFEALVEAGLSVIVLRPRKGRYALEAQTAVLLDRSQEIASGLREAESPMLIRVNKDGISTRSLQELIEEIR